MTETPDRSASPKDPPRPGPAGLGAAWRALVREQRLVVAAAVGLLGTMLLPWYSRSVNAIVGGRLETASSSKLAITVFSFVEAAIFLVAAGVTVLMLARGQRRAFHLPGGDGLVVTAAGGWATFLVFYRFVDKPGGGGGGQLQVEYGLSWGIFFGLLAALALVGAGLRLRAAQVVEPALPSHVAPGPAVGAHRPAAAENPTRVQRREEREARRRANADTPVRERRPGADEAPTRPFGEPPAFQAPELPPPPGAREE